MNPLVGTKWTTLPVGKNVINVIQDDAHFNNTWQQLSGNFVPSQDYIFKFSGNRSEYLLVGIKADDTGIFLNITKANSLKYLPLDASSLTLLRTDPFSGTITQTYGGANPVPKPTLAKSQVFATGATPNLPSKTFKDVVVKKIITPKRTCPKCKGGMTLLFTNFSCDKGCK